MKISQPVAGPSIRPQETEAPAAPANAAGAADVKASTPAAEVVRLDRPARSDVFSAQGRQDAHRVGLDSADAVSAIDGKSAEHYYAGMGPATHVVQKGETLTGIAKAQYPADQYWEGLPETIAHYNQLEDANLIKVGQELQLPWRYTYTVQAGDTLSRIAAFSENPLSDIVAANGIENPDLIQVGQKLVLDGPYGDAYAVLSDRVWDHAKELVHTVKAGDTLSALVRQYFPEAGDTAQYLVEELAHHNGIEDPNLIRVGQELKIPGVYTYEVQEGDTRWSLNEIFSGGVDLDFTGEDGSTITAPKPGDLLRISNFGLGC